MEFLLRDAGVEQGLIDVGSDSGEDQALELGRGEGLDLPLHRLAGVEPVPSGEPRPTGVSGLPHGRGQLVRADLVVREQDASPRLQQAVRATQSRSMSAPEASKSPT
ncbi:hypothetical protein [Streptomyces sp. C]|uniref:hypothetical protein n=1 Tax=Streptomyces sp. C TaxID=253839 RepID=UPI0001B4D57A|nr:hypothetical protein [Streptomyces sp. C]